MNKNSLIMKNSLIILLSILVLSVSNSCKKQKVLHGAISDLKSLMVFNAACCVPNTGLLKSINVVILKEKKIKHMFKIIFPH